MSAPEVRFCAECGADGVEGDRFCRVCGRSTETMANGAPDADVHAWPGSAPRLLVTQGGPSFGGIFVRAAVAFGLLEVLGSAIVGRLLIPALVQSSGAIGLEALRNQIAMMIYAVTALAGVGASIYLALASRHGMGRRSKTVVGVVAAEWAVTAAGIGIAVWRAEPVVADTIATHALIGALASIGTILLLSRTRPPRAAVSAAVGVALFCHAVLAPLPAAAARAPEHAAATGPAADIAPSDCDLRVISGSVSGSLALNLIPLPTLIPGWVTGEGAMSFDYAATEHGDGSWSVSSSAGLTAGPGLEFGLPDLVTAKITTTAGAKITTTYRLASAAAATEVLEASMTSFSWSAMGFAGLTVLGPQPGLLADIRQGLPPTPEAVEFRFLGSTEWSISAGTSLIPDISSASASFTMENSAWIAEVNPQGNIGDITKQSQLSVGFSLEPSLGVDAHSPWLAAKAGLTGDVSVSIELEHDGLSLTEASMALDASAWTTATDLSKPNLHDLVINRLASALGAKVDATMSDKVTAHAALTGLMDPDVDIALMKLLTWSARAVDGASVLPAVSDSEALDAIFTLLKHSEVNTATYDGGSWSASGGPKLGLADLSAAGSLDYMELQSAMTSEGGAPLHSSQTCIASGARR